MELSITDIHARFAQGFLAYTKLTQRCNASGRRQRPRSYVSFLWEPLMGLSSATYAAAFGFVVGVLCDALLILGADEDDSSRLSCGKAAC